MQENELNYYNEIGNWNFEDIKQKTEKITDWDFYQKIRENSSGKSICLDLGTGGGERVLKEYPNVGLVIGTDFSENMIKTAKLNLKKYPDKNVKFVQMNNLEMKFPDKFFDIISARHTVINAKQIFNCLSDEGTLIIEGVDRKDCWELKELFGKGQGNRDEKPISEKDYNSLVEAGFERIEKVEIVENEFYETEEDLYALLLRTPILDDFLEIDKKSFQHKSLIDLVLFKKYIKQYRTEKGILLKRVLYGIVAKKQ